VDEAGHSTFTLADRMTDSQAPVTESVGGEASDSQPAAKGRTPPKRKR
jgi:hypothetical protein